MGLPGRVSRWLVVLVLGLLLPGLVGCGDGGDTAGDAADQDGEAGPEGEPIRFLFIGGLTGSLSVNAEAAVDTTETAFAIINDEGGVLGRPLERATADSALDPTQAVSALQEAVASDRPDIVYAGTLSSEALALLPVLTQEGILATCTCNATPINDAEQWTTFIGGCSPSNQALGVPVAERVAELGYQRVAVLYGDDASAVDWFENGFVPAAEEAGVEIVAHEAVDSSSLDYTPAIERLRQSDPDVFVARAFGEPAARVLQARERVGFDEVFMVADPTFSAVDLAQLTDLSEVENMEIVGFDVQQWRPHDELSPARQELVDALSAEGDITSMLSYVGQVWDLVFSAVAAIDEAGTLEPDAVRAALFDLADEPNPRLTFQATSGIDADNLVRRTSPEAYAVFPPGPMVDGMVKSEP